MDFQKDIEERLVKKGLSQSSIKLYIKNLMKLNDNMKIKNFNFLTNVNGIMEKLQPLKPNTIKAYLTCIVSVLNTYTDNKKTAKLCESYYNIMKEAVKKLKEIPSGSMSKTQADNWMDWDDIVKIYKELHTKVMEFIKNKELNDTQYNSLLSFVVLSLYVLLPPRRNMDYCVMNIKKTVSDNDKKDKNYLDIDKKKFIFNVFKTSKHNEGSSEDIPFLVYKDGEPFKAINSITRILNKIFNKKIGVSMLRHSYLTAKYGNDSIERQRDSEAMGHNLATQSQYIKNKDIVIHFD